MFEHPIILADILKSANDLMQRYCCNIFPAINFARKFEICNPNYVISTT